MNKQTETITAN